MRGIRGGALLIMLTNIFLQPSIQYCSLEQVSHTTICPVYVDVCVGARVGHHVAGLDIVNASVRKYDYFFLKKIKTIQYCVSMSWLHVLIGKLQ